MRLLSAAIFCVSLLSIYCISCDKKSEDSDKKKPYKVNFAIEIHDTDVPEPFTEIWVHSNTKIGWEWRKMKLSDRGVWRANYSIRNDTKLEYRFLLTVEKGEKSDDHGNHTVNVSSISPDTLFVHRNVQWDFAETDDWPTRDIYAYQNMFVTDYLESNNLMKEVPDSTRWNAVNDVQSLWGNEAERLGWDDHTTLNVSNYFWFRQRTGPGFTSIPDETDQKIITRFLIPQIRQDADFLKSMEDDRMFEIYSGSIEFMDLLNQNLSHNSWLEYRSATPLVADILNNGVQNNISLITSYRRLNYLTFVNRHLDLYDALHAPDANSMYKALDNALSQQKIGQLKRENQDQVNKMFRRALSRMNTLANTNEAFMDFPMDKMNGKLLDSWAQATSETSISNDSLTNIAGNLGVQLNTENRARHFHKVNSTDSPTSLLYKDLRNNEMVDFSSLPDMKLLVFYKSYPPGPEFLKDVSKKAKENGFSTFLIATDPVQPGFLESDSLITPIKTYGITYPALLDRTDASLTNKFGVDLSNSLNDFLWVKSGRVLIQSSKDMGKMGRSALKSEVDPFDVLNERAAELSNTAN